MNIIRISFGIFLIILAESVVSDGLFSQSLPDFLTFAEDGRRLRLGGVESGGFYNESEINTVYLDFYDADYWQQMKDNYNTQEYVLAMLTIGDRTYDSVAVQFKGQTSYTKPEKEDSEKLSFDVKLGEVIDGQEIDGYSTLNFNNAFQDPSFMREVLYAHLSREHMPAVKGNFVRLYLNGEDWGLYPNIQQLNGDFIREWFMNNNGIRWRADKPPWYEPNDPVLKGTGEVPPGPDWGDGTAALNYLGDDPSEYQKYYTLKSSEIDDPWSYLIRICDILNNVPPDEM
ncbi:MAG: CotH kinase family protein [Bacteroidales bacterium]|nr:CotH kinase family protein [Bacteroidales bacterium]